MLFTIHISIPNPSFHIPSISPGMANPWFNQAHILNHIHNHIYSADHEAKHPYRHRWLLE